MARAKNSGNGQLEQASRDLTQAQATLAQHQTALLARASETDRQMAETNRINSERFARIKTILAEHSRILTELIRMIQALPEAVREKFGFQPPQRPAQ
jgi:hypothetical protein